MTERATEIEIVATTVTEVIEAVLSRIPNYKIDLIDEPIGEEATSLNDFLENNNDGSEWTDPKGFKINIAGGEYKISF
ncbi:MAG: hypothetical protein WC817_00995 [Patescibacteria group bacterium]|jgi:hypothetical protein